MQPEMPYVAPARYPLTVLHRIDPGREADLFGQDERVDGYTRCGKPFLESELWMPVEGRDGDLLCTGCMLPGNAGSAAEDVAGVLF